MLKSKFLWFTLLFAAIGTQPHVNAAQTSDPLFKEGTSSIIGVNHVGLSVSDLKNSLSFYENAIGLVPEDMKFHPSNSFLSIDDISVPSPKIAILSGPNSYIRLMEFGHAGARHQTTALPVQGPGVTHICFQAPKSKPLDAKAITHGATWVSSSNAMVDLRGVGFMYGYLRDPSGLMFELEHAPEPKFDVDVWVGHVAIAAHDLTEAIDFYEKLLGIAHYRRVDNISGPTFDEVAGIESGVLNGAWLRVAPFYNIELWQYQNPPTLPPSTPKPVSEIGYNSIAFETTDIDADYQRITKLGIVPETGIVPIDGGRAFFLRDPVGTLLSLQEYDAGSPFSLKAINSQSGDY